MVHVKQKSVYGVETRMQEASSTACMTLCRLPVLPIVLVSTLENTFYSRHFGQPHILLDTHMGWLRLVGSLKLQVSFAKEPYKRDDILKKRPMILRSLLLVATPYVYLSANTYILYMYACRLYAGDLCSQKCSRRHSRTPSQITPLHVIGYTCVYPSANTYICTYIQVAGIQPAGVHMYVLHMSMEYRYTHEIYTHDM